ncbi:unnamed protein product [Anisakis simplex]|uniref:Lupus La protein (inferred by orthology to a human protein) n=1 Tax=Anisakis simplex TaxID=6269 RepID=A0A158PNQ5_ANISI|nr:unnamed protein product [Anisakis simplex]
MTDEKSDICNASASAAAHDNENVMEKPQLEKEPTSVPEKDAVNGAEAKVSPELAKKIVEQVENISAFIIFVLFVYFQFYFGDINLPRDRFLQDEIKKDEGWVALTTMTKFNRLAQLTTDVSVIAEALQNSQLLEVNEDKTRVRRDPEIALPENSLEYWQGIKHRTVYVKGFKLDSTLDDIQKFVKQFGDVDNVLMRRDKSTERSFKGSAFITYKTREMCENFVNNDVKKFEGSDLIKMMQDDYWAMKQQQMKNRKAADRNAKLAKKVAESDEKETSSVTAHFMKGMILSVEGLPTEDVDVNKIKTFFRKFGDVAYVVFSSGNDKAQIRFSGEENCAKKAWDQAVSEAGEEGKVMMDGKELKGAVLEGEEEEKYWNDFNQNRANKQSRMDQNRRGRGRSRNRGRGGHHSFGGDRGGGTVVPNKKREGDQKEEGDASEAKKPKKTVFADEE